MRDKGQFTIREMMLLVMFISAWLTITLQLGLLSILFWSLAIAMAHILRPAHQRRQTPETVTDVLAVAVSWAVACGIVGAVLDFRLTSFGGNFSWALLGQLTGFYLGLLWILVVLLARHVERLFGRVQRPT